MTVDKYIPLSRIDARSLGLKHFFTGRPCSRGHIALRYVSDQACTECKKVIKLVLVAKIKADPVLLEARRTRLRKAKARARKTDAGKLSSYQANKKYIEKNRDKVRAYYRERAKSNPEFRASKIARSMVHRLLARTNERKDGRCEDILGYTARQLKVHIERQFTKGMTWALMGREIHIDHIIPVAEYLRNGETRPRVINALPNLRPMWARENIIKSDAVVSLV